MALILARAILIASLMISCACTKALAQIPMIGLGGQRCGAWTANISSDSGGVGLLISSGFTDFYLALLSGI